MRGNRRLRHTAAAAACALLAGCGTTVHLNPSAARSADPQVGPGSVAASLGIASPAAASGTVGLGAAPSANTGAAAVRATTTAAIGSVHLVPGAPIKVGFILPVPAADANGTRTVGEDYTPIVRALVADINQHGGFGGHHVNYVQLGLELNYDRKDESEDENVACVHLIEDEHVDVVVSIGSVRFSTQCYVDHKVPVLVRTANSSLDDSNIRDLYPWVIPDDTPDLESQARTLAAGLAHAGFLGRGHRLGVAALDTTQDRAVVTHLLLPALRRAGATLPDPNDVIYADGFADKAGADAANAINRWNNDHVDRVVLFDLLHAWGILSVLADQQKFYPRWGFDSADAALYVLQKGGQATMPPAGEHDVTLVSWYPIWDVQDEGYPLQPSERECLRVVDAGAGLTYDQRNYDHGAAALTTCRSLAFAQAVFARLAGQPLEALADAAKSLGTTYRPQDMPMSWFSSTKADGSAVYRTGHYEEWCACLVYDDTPWRRTPQR